MPGARLDSFGGAFALRVRQMLPEGFNEQEDLFIEPGMGLAVLRQENGTYRPLGCPLCLLGQRGQNEWGEPTLEGQKLLEFDDIWPGDPHSYGPEITSNTWACPRCRIFLPSLLPNFLGRKDAQTL